MRSIPSVVLVGFCLAAGLSLRASPALAAWETPDLAALPKMWDFVDNAAWEPERGDVLLIDTSANVGYLMHSDRRYTQFRVATGQRRVVRYIGRVYNAATPVGYWVAHSLEVQGDRITFDADGLFLRLYANGEKRTSYGIHSHRSVDRMLADNERFKSMGCILVSRATRRLIGETFLKNSERLPVWTVYGIEQWGSSFAPVVADNGKTHTEF